MFTCDTIDTADVGVALRMSIENCGKCGITFAIPLSYMESQRESAGGFYCPGCGTHYGWSESEADKLKRRLKTKSDALSREIARHDQTRADRDHQERRARSLRGVVTRTKNRVGKGVCPCCSRTFQNLGRHMASRHPEYASSEAE